MLRRPQHLDSKDKIYSLRGKFNSVLEEQLLFSKNNAHRIMSIEIRSDEFDLQGNLTAIGKSEFWKEVDRAIKKFDMGSIKLLPRKFTTTKKSDNISKNRSSTTFLQRVAEQYKKKAKTARKRLTWSPYQKSRSPRREENSNRYHKENRRSHSRSHHHSSTKSRRYSRSRSRDRRNSRHHHRH